MNTSRNKPWLLMVLLAATMVLNFVLALRVRDLERRYSGGSPPTQNALLGVTVQPLHVSEIDGAPFTVDFTATTRPTALYVLNPRCHWCAVNEENIKALTQSAGNRFRFIGLSTDDGSLKDFAKTHNIGMPVLRLSSYESSPELALGATPELIVISADKVVRVWLGAFSGSTQSEVESYFSVKLPGAREGQVQKVNGS